MRPTVEDVQKLLLEEGSMTTRQIVDRLTQKGFEITREWFWDNLASDFMDEGGTAHPVRRH
jgi:hypothetical protein